MTVEVEQESVHLSDIVARLRRAMRRSARVWSPGSALSVAQLELLSTIEENPGARPGELARLLRLAPNSVSTLANALASSGMLHRDVDPSAARAALFELTDDALMQVHTWRDTNAAALAAALDALTLDDQLTVTAALPALARLVAMLDAQTEAAVS
jgi:DNA-binding MarR family transcriptional regulator